MHQILFVDDEPLFLNMLKRMLHSHEKRWKAIFVSDADKAFEYAAEHPVDMIVTDIQMPGRSGMDLLAQLKADERTISIPVVMLTGHGDSQIRFRALEMGAQDLLRKPFDRAELVARIKNGLQLKTYHDRLQEQNRILSEEIRDRSEYARLVSRINTALVVEADLTRMLRKCCHAIVRHLHAAFARIWVLDDRENHLELLASDGMYTHVDGAHQYIPLGELKIGKIAMERKPLLTNEVIGDPDVHEQTWAQKEGMVAFAGHPLIAGGRLTGVLGMFSREKLSDHALDVLASVADGIALGIAQKKIGDEARFYSSYDPLTLLPNRAFFYGFLEKTLNHARRSGSGFALVLLDLDDFKRINESLGHTAGDLCLKVVSKRMLSVLRDSDCLTRMSDNMLPLSRLDGDRYAVLLRDICDAQRVTRVIGRLRDSLCRAIGLDGREVVLRASMGVALYPSDAKSSGDLLRNAEAALFHAKARGKNDFSFYARDMNRRALKTLDLEIGLRRALERDEFRLFYQPKVDLDRYQISGAEALIRWKKSDDSLVAPVNFIPLAEENGLIIPMGEWALATACRKNFAWQAEGLTSIALSVNVSGCQFGQKDFVPKVLKALGDSGLSGSSLLLEITETSLMMHPNTAIGNLNILRNAGIRISLDDFGTGYSSLAYLQKLPVDELKIDISFIRNLLFNANDATMVKTIIDMAHNMGIRVVAEGVEDEGQLAHLASIGCDTVQGFLFSRPVPEAEFTKMLAPSFSFPLFPG